MKILILRQPQVPAGFPGGIAGGACYQTDMLFNGLRNLIGNEVVDYERTWWMYQDDFGPGKLDPDVYCPRGFTIYRTLESDAGVDRTDIEEKIKNNFFDLIIFGYTHYGIRPGSWELVTKHYPKNKIVWIDGGDLWSDMHVEKVDKCIYFKREIIDDTYPGLHPINLALPVEKMSSIFRNKNKLLAPMDPRNKASYIYNDEKSYYEQYAESLFAITTTKNSWNALRHYEIMANNCIPLFLDMEKCPEKNMVTLPKLLLKEALDKVNQKDLEWFTTSEGISAWYDLNDRIQNHFRKYCTTEALAKYVLDVVKQHQK